MGFGGSWGGGGGVVKDLGLLEEVCPGGGRVGWVHWDEVRRISMILAC